MSKKANPKLVGSFVVGAVFLAVAGFFLLGGGIFREKVKCVAFFDGSVKGLSVGAPVAFRGVKVGTVTDIQLRIEGKELNYRIPVFFEIETARLTVVGGDDRPRAMNADRLIERGLRAQLTVQSFVTGLLMIELDFRPDTPPRLVGTLKDYPEIPTIPSDLEAFLRRFEEVPIEDLLNQVTEIVRAVKKVVDSRDFTEALRNLRDMLENMNAVVIKVEAHADPLLNEGTLALKELKSTLANLNKRLPGFLDKADATTGAARNVAVQMDRQLPALMLELEQTLKTAREVLQQTGAAMEKVGTTAQGDSPLMHSLHEVMAEVTSASRSVRVLADYLQSHPEALLRGKKP